MAALDTLPIDPRKKNLIPGADPSSAYLAGQAVNAAGQRVVNTVQDLAAAPVRTGIAAARGVSDFVTGLGTPGAPPTPVDTTIGPPKPAGIATPPPIKPAVTTPADSGATSISGRPLGYGANVNGVRTFSDGTGGIPATIADTQVGVLANKVNRADAGIGGGIGTEANGGTLDLSAGAITPTGRPAAAVDPIARAQAINATAEQNAASDIASIANRDPRSVLGSAARNAAVDARSVGGVKGATALSDALTGLYGVAEKPLASASSLGDISVRDAGEMSRAQLQSRTDLQREGIARTPLPERVPLADGTLGILGPDGVVRPARDASGGAVRPQEGKPQVDLPSYGKAVNEISQQLLGVDQVTGMIPDPTDPKKSRVPTAQEMGSVADAARVIAGKRFGVSAGAPGGPPAEGGIAAAPAKPTKQQFVAAALKAGQRPGVTQADLEKYYDKTYGAQ